MVQHPEANADPSEITLPAGDDSGVPDQERGRYPDPAAAGAERAGDPPPQEDAEELESALREGAGAIVPGDEYEKARRERSTEPGPGTSLT